MQDCAFQRARGGTKIGIAPQHFMARILIADDEVDLVEIFAEILRDEGHDVRTALDGVDALQTIKAWHPDLAVLDLDMPGLPGSSIAVELSKERNGLETMPVVLLSGNANVKPIAEELGIRYSATKPVALVEFIAIIDTATRR